MSLWPLYLAALMILSAAALILVVLRLRRQEAELPQADALPGLAAEAPGSFADAATAVVAAAVGGAGVAAVAAPERAPQAPVCPRCGAPLMPRAAAGRQILLCSRFPTCNYGSLK